jgi:hypothetical protein
MRISKCKTCKNYNKFYNSCDLYFDEVYLGEGDYDIVPVSIRRITTKDCQYEKEKNNR